MRRVDGLLQLTISDQGIGFDPNVMSKAGESGRGFGLFSVRERLELFGGTIEIQSSPGQGSRIFLTVPMLELTNGQPTHIQVPFLPEALVARRPPAYKIGRKIRILLADDHAVVRRGMADILGDEPDFDVVGEAEDGQEALELARKLLPDVILMDLNMPRLNGVEATRVICNEFPEIRIIGLSMFEEAERAQAMRDAGAVCYLTKSGAAETLIGAIRKHGMRDERLLADSSLLNQT
jgi:CheY-like chemotaxis protein